jgi:GTPase-activating protein SAC7
LSGSEKRIKELQKIFNSPDRYGKGLDWTGYTVHDAANILRRYINQLPEPIIPLEFYQRFRDPLRNHQSQAVGSMDGQTPSQGAFDLTWAIMTYQELIKQLPPLNRQLLLYILDLLAVFASKSDLNKMTTANLAAIFQPGILSHPSHDMAVQEYRLSQDVLIFLIENQDHFLIGMPGTAADERTVQEVESGPPTPANRPSSSNHLVRSGSNSSRNSAGVTAVGVRRSVSASSRKSRGSIGTGGAPSPITPVAASTGSGLSGSGVHRSNTLPPRSPNVLQNRFPGGAAIHESDTPPKSTVMGRNTTNTTLQAKGVHNSNEPSATSKSIPNHKENVALPGADQAPVLISHPPKKFHSQAVMHEVMTPTENMPMFPESLTNPPPPQPGQSKAREGPYAAEQTSSQMQSPPRQQAPETLTTPTSPNRNYQTSPPDQTTPTMGISSKGGTFANLFGPKSPPQASATDDGGAMLKKQKPNKLQKRPKERDPESKNGSAHSSTGSLGGDVVAVPTAGIAHTSAPDASLATSPPVSEYLAPLPPQMSSGGASVSSGGHLKPGMSPGMGSVSAPSQMSDVEEGLDILGTNTADQQQKRKWFSRRHHDSQQIASSAIPQQQSGMGSNGIAGMSHSSVLSTSEGRRSTTMDRGGVTSDSEQDVPGTSFGTRRDPISWVKGKIREGRGKLRVASPTREPFGGNSTSNLDQNLLEGGQYAKIGIVEPVTSASGLTQAIRGRSFEVQRDQTYLDHVVAGEDNSRPSEPSGTATPVPLANPQEKEAI